MTEDEDAELRVTNSLYGSPQFAVQAGVIEGDVNYLVADNHDIELVISHESSDITLTPGRSEVLYLEVTNHSPQTRLLEFRTFGVPGLDCAIVPDNGEIKAGRQRLTLLVQCNDTEPMAGPYQLTVRAADKRADSQRWWTSEPRSITIASKPAITATLIPGERRVSGVGFYEMSVRLENKGNTSIPNSQLVVDADEGGLLIEFPHGPDFSLAHRQGPVDLPVRLGLRVQGWFSRTWRIPVRLEPAREDVDPLVLSQHGVGSDLSLLIVTTANWLYDWGGTRHERRNAWLVACGALVLFLGVLVGRWFAPAGEPAVASPPSTATTILTASAAPPEPAYAEMPCSPGTSVLILQSMEDNDLPHAKYLAEVENARLARVGQAGRFEVRISKRADVCRAVLGTDIPTGEKFTLFLWLGPVPSADALAVCAAIAKTEPDCQPAGTA